MQKHHNLLAKIRESFVHNTTKLEEVDVLHGKHFGIVEFEGDQGTCK